MIGWKGALVETVPNCSSGLPVFKLEGRKVDIDPVQSAGRGYNTFRRTLSASGQVLDDLGILWEEILEGLVKLGRVVVHSVVDDVVADLAAGQEVPVACQEHSASQGVGAVVGNLFQHLLLPVPLGNNVDANHSDDRFVASCASNTNYSARNKIM